MKRLLRKEIMPAIFTRTFSKAVLDWLVTFAVADLMYAGLQKGLKRIRKPKTA